MTGDLGDNKLFAQACIKMKQPDTTLRIGRN